MLILTFRWLEQGIKNRNSVLNRVGKSAMFFLNRVRVWGAAPHLPTQGYIEYPPRGYYIIPIKKIRISRICTYIFQPHFEEKITVVESFQGHAKNPSVVVEFWPSFYFAQKRLSIL